MRRYFSLGAMGLPLQPSHSTLFVAALVALTLGLLVVLPLAVEVAHCS